MIKIDKIEIKTTNKNVGYYKNIGYNIKSGDVIIINVSDLPGTSKYKIDVSCDNCKKEYKISYFSYLRNIKSDIYYCKKCSGIRAKETNLEKYGVEHPLQLEEFKNKSKETNLEKYGFEYSIQNSNIRDKSKNTIKEKYGSDEYMSTEDFKKKSKITLTEKYGVEHPLQNNLIKLKVENTCMKRYSAKSPLESDIIKEKISIVKKDRYGDEFYNNRDKYKETCLERFGFENPMQNEFVKQKLSNIVFEKYGVYHPAQNDTIYKKMMKNGIKISKYNESDIYYQGEYELDFLNKYFNKIKIGRGKSIKYIFNEQEYVYFPDFYFPDLNLIIEIKSSYWYNKHYAKNLAKEKVCKENGYNFLFIINKNYEIFEKMINPIIYNKEHSWQYDLRLNTLEYDIKNINFDYTKLKISDFKFESIEKNDIRTKEVVEFIKKYEWLGKMPNRPTHRFIATYDNILAGVIVMSTPNSFSMMLGENTSNIEKLISRGACASWTPKNLASSLLMWSINWMVKNTEFRLFEAYADPEAKELGTIYQACNFYYLGDNFGSDKLYFNPNNPNGWVNNRGFRKLNFYKSFLKKNGIIWNNEWSKKTTILWNKIPNDIVIKMKEYSVNCLNGCHVRKPKNKHKYAYVIGKNKKKTKLLRKYFEKNNKIFPYPKNR
jgi:very-short-patch-repair endonuclease